MLQMIFILLSVAKASDQFRASFRLAQPLMILEDEQKFKMISARHKYAPHGIKVPLNDDMTIFACQTQVKFPKAYQLHSCPSNIVENFLTETILDNIDRLDKFEFAIDKNPWIITEQAVFALDFEIKKLTGHVLCPGTDHWKFCDNTLVMLRKKGCRSKSFASDEKLAGFAFRNDLPKTALLLAPAIDPNSEIVYEDFARSFFSLAVSLGYLEVVSYFLQHKNPDLAQDSYFCCDRIVTGWDTIGRINIEEMNILWHTIGYHRRLDNIPIRRFEILRLVMERLKKERPHDMANMRFVDSKFLKFVASNQYSKNEGKSLWKMPVYDSVAWLNNEFEKKKVKKAETDPKIKEENVNKKRQRDKEDYIMISD